MIQSELYRKVLEYAFGMCRKDGKASVNSDYFVTALLNLVLAESRAELDGIPEIYIYNKAAVKKELAEVSTIFSRYNIDIMDVAVKLENAVRQSPVDEQAGVKFQVLERTAVKKLGDEGKSELTTADMLELMLDEPTEYIGAFITSAGKKQVQESAEEARQPEQNEEQQTEQPAPSDESAVTDAAEFIQSTLFDDITASDDEETLPDSDRKRAFSTHRQPTGDRYGGYSGAPVEHRSTDDPIPTVKTRARLTLIDHAKNVKDIQNKLLDKVLGQDLAVEMFVSGYFQAELVSMIMKKRKKPRATFLFAGPPGVGKTFLAETAAEVLGLPFMRFDMSEYSNHESAMEFAGTDKVYKGAHEGAVTSFVYEYPHCILLFDEVEKAHLNVIHLFLQILDAGRLRDTFTECEVDFTDAIIIFTTNAGKKLYEDPDIINLSGVPRKTILRALSAEQRTDGTPYFPEAVCSRFASGNVVMFNRLGAHDLLNIASKELKYHAEALQERTGVDIEIGKDINYAVLYSEGGKADARAIRGKAVNFFYRELYEFYRLASSDKKASAFNKVALSVEPSSDSKIAELFAPAANPEVLIFADDDLQSRCAQSLSGVTAHFASDVETAKNIIVENEISIIICDIKCKQRSGRQLVLNLEDIDSEGRDFFNYVSRNVATPLYVLGGGYDISSEELLSFSRNGAMGVVSLTDGDDAADGKSFNEQILEECNIAKQQRNMTELARSRKVLSYQSAQSYDGETAKITLFDLKLSVAVDAEDDSVLSGMSRPDVKFGDVIGAEDAKRELGYFTEFLHNPKLFAKNGVRPPKGILLYGPPGTGKTLLAKALAGESEATFIAAEGNSFMNKYVGEGPRLVHELFATARKYAPAVLFIDEIDAVGISRAEKSADSDHTSDILTAILTEMDGFKSHPDRPVFVLAATNVGVDGSGKKQLDPALLRRFDRRIMVDLPNKAEREQFLRMQCERNQNVKISETLIQNLAVRSTGMSLADLASVTEMALRDALMSPDFSVTDDVMEEAFETYNSGEVKKWDESTLLRTARHECGHALMCWLGGETPSYLTVVARDSHGGYMQHADAEDKQIYTKSDLLANIRTSLGGRAAELVYYGDEDGVTTGPSSDLAHATATAERLICTYGMDEKIGLSSIDASKIMYTPYYSVIRDRVNEILGEQLNIAKRAITACRPAVDELVSILLENNKLKGEQIDEILKKHINR